MKRESFVAHRGYAGRYPENTLLAMEKAVEAGALYLECDIHLTADHVPVLFHDHFLKRMTGKSGKVFKKTFQELGEYSVGEPGRFGEEFSAIKITPLVDMVVFLQKNPSVTLFVELKESSLHRFRVDFMVEKVMEILRPAMKQCIAISYSLDAIASARKYGWEKTGWVLKRFDNLHRRRADQFEPDYLFCDYEFIHPLRTHVLWKGSWKWVLFEIPDALLAREWFELGTDMVETMEIGTMLSQHLLEEK